jgi:ParB/RepB/Spo0J family partition protein
MPRSSHVRPLARDLLARSSGEVTTQKMADVYESSLDRLQGALLIPIDHVAIWSENPRKSYDEAYIASLADSIAENGLLQLPTVRRNPDKPGHYIITTGNCRLLAVRRLHGSADPEVRQRFARLECRLKEQDEAEAFADAVAENVARNDLSRSDFMAAVVRMQDRYGWSARAIAKRIGRDYSDLSELLRIARHPVLADLVNGGAIKATTAGTILGLPEEARAEAIARARDGRIKTMRDVTAFSDAQRARRHLAHLQATAPADVAAAAPHPGESTGDPNAGGPQGTQPGTADAGRTTSDEHAQCGISHTRVPAVADETPVHGPSASGRTPSSDPVGAATPGAQVCGRPDDRRRSADQPENDHAAHVRATQDLVRRIQAYVRQTTALDAGEVVLLKEAQAALRALIAAHEG